MKREYRRHLPHQIPEDTPIFVTWNLKGSLPQEALDRIEAERVRLKAQAPRAGESVRDRRIREQKIVFALADRILDTQTEGPMYLQDRAAAKIVEDAIQFGVPARYELYAWCVMGNHVHVLLKPLWVFKRLMQGMKGYAARKINISQQQTGRVVWQDESFDHWVRDEPEFFRIIAYIENNPVKAGLCPQPEQWLWSSARFRSRWPIGQPFHADFVAPMT